jgi:hypothetical protein
MLTFPDNTSILDTRAVKMAMTDDGILHVLYKKVNARTLSDMQQAVQEAKKLVGEKLVGNRKICIIADITNISLTTPDVRNLIAAELPKATRAVAILSGSAIGKMMANLFFSLKPQPFPVKIFDDETAARKWLAKHASEVI